MSTKGVDNSSSSLFKSSHTPSRPGSAYQGDQSRTPYIDLRGVEHNRGAQEHSAHTAKVETPSSRRSSVTERDKGQLGGGGGGGKGSGRIDPRYPDTLGISKETYEFNTALQAMADVDINESYSRSAGRVESHRSGSSSPTPRCITHKRESKPLESARQGMRTLEEQINRHDPSGGSNLESHDPSSSEHRRSSKNSTPGKVKEKEKGEFESYHSNGNGSGMASKSSNPSTHSLLNRNSSGNNISLGNGGITPRSNLKQVDSFSNIDPYEDDFEMLDEIEEEEEDELELAIEPEGRRFDADSVLKKNRYRRHTALLMFVLLRTIPLYSFSLSYPSFCPNLSFHVCVHLSLSLSHIPLSYFPLHESRT